MSKINILLANANNRFRKEEEKKIIKAIKAAEDYSFPRLHIDWDIDVVVTNCGPVSVIPEDHVGGHTYESSFIILHIDKETTEPIISEVLCHELCHAARWGKNDEWMNTLFDAVIFEGLATFFESKYAERNKEKQFFIRTIMDRSDEENEKILSVLRPQLWQKKYDYDAIFFSGNNKLPRWAGYSLGFYLVKKYLTQNDISIENAFANKYRVFKSIV